MIIGLTGFNGCGKGKVAEYLEKKGFSKFSLSDELREEARKKGVKELTKEFLIILGNELREKNGPNYLAIRVSEKIKKVTQKI